MNIKRLKRIFLFLTGVCPVCGKPFKYPRMRRMNTAYVKDELNYMRSCRRCFEEMEVVYDAQWDEYYSSRF